jgi:hypothetical protein
LNTKDYTYLLNKPYSLNDRQTTELESILTEFPYLQSARAIYLKGLYNRDSFRYNTELKKTAAFTTDRAVLFDFITSEEFRSIDKKVHEDTIKAVSEIVVNDSETLKDSPVLIPPADKLEESIKLSIKEATAEEIITIDEPEIIQQPQPVAEVPMPVPETVVTKETVEVTTPIIRNIPSTESAAKIIVGSPLEFSESETHSFAEWLQLSKLAPIERETPAPPPVINEQLDKKYSLIDKFIEANPKIAPVKKDAPSPVNTGKNVGESPGLMTETLARVYLEQKKYTKAIQAYQILILKYPEKNAFFADRILEVKNLQQNIIKEQ